MQYYGPGPSSPRNTTWLSERTPGRLDAENAQSPIARPFMELFEQNLHSHPTASQTIQYLTLPQREKLVSETLASTKLSYPLLMIDAMLELPPEERINRLVDQYVVDIHPTLPLLNHTPVEHIGVDGAQDYLRYAMASIAAQSQMTSSSIQEAETLWWTANLLIAWSLEIDNREARNNDLFLAWAILGALGILASDRKIWKRTNITHGYVEAAIRRHRQQKIRSKYALADSQADFQPASAVTNWSLNHIVLCDVMRAFHYNSHSTFIMRELLARSDPVNAAFHEIYDCIVGQGCAPPTSIPRESATMALVAILDDIHHLNTIFKRLSPIECPRSSQNASLDMFIARPSVFINPYLPGTPCYQNRVSERRLQKALEIWSESFKESASSEVLALYHFCCLYLHFPELSLLPTLADYAPHTQDTKDSQPDIYTALENSMQEQEENILRDAWLVYDYVEQSPQRALAAVWMPIVTFYAGLAVWHLITAEVGSARLGSLRMIKLFQAELQRMNWPCCAAMASTLQKLMLQGKQ